MKAGVVRFPGSNCDRDCYIALEKAGFETVFLWHKDKGLSSVDLVVLPGGFSYGDYLRCGAIARFSPIMEAVVNFAHRGGLVAGICNGFQILTEAGLLPGALLRNRDMRFICRYTPLKVENTDTPFTRLYKKGAVIHVPIAHGEGSYTCDDDTYRSLEKNEQIVFRYSDKEGEVSDKTNPNGSRGNVAGVVNKQGNVLGMMPHPERANTPLLSGADGALFFEGLKSYNA